MKKVVKYELHYIITLLVCVLFLILSFCPVIPVWNYKISSTSTDPVPYVEYNQYYTQIFTFIRKAKILPFIFAIGMIASYFTCLLIIIFVFFTKNKQVKITLVISCISHLLGVFSFSLITWFSFIFFLAFLIILALDIVIDYRKYKSVFLIEKRKKEKMQKIGLIIKSKRTNMRLTQQELADKVFVSRSLIAKFENGTSLPSDKQIKDISNILEISDNDFNI